MAKRNDLTDQQEIVIRNFLDECVTFEIALAPVIISELIARMGYKIVAPGKVVAQDKEIKTIYGDPDPFKDIQDEYGPDGEALRERLNAANNDNDTDEADPSEPTESDPVGDVLQQDV